MRSQGQPGRFGYQGDYAEFDEETGLNYFELRFYDSKIGRWLRPDPYRQHFSPYMSMSNRPTSVVDPDGGCANDDYACWRTAYEDGLSYEQGLNLISSFGPMVSDFSLSMDFVDQIGASINAGGYDQFISSFERLGVDWFFDAAEQNFPHNAAGFMAWMVENREGVGPAISLSRLTHHWIDNEGWTPELNQQEHFMGMFLIAEKFGEPTARFIGDANEVRGLIINDRQSGNMWRALLGRPARNGRSTAFEYSDLNHNSIGLNKWREYHGLPIILQMR